MREYEKPIMQISPDLSEGVYLSSGSSASTGDSGAPKCDSSYMKGVWQGYGQGDWNQGNPGYKLQFGCLGCPANTGSGCGLLTHYADSGYAGSYDVDNGNRKPSWEKKGYGPNDPVTDWNM